VLDRFTVYDDAGVVAESVLPAGGAYNLQAGLTLGGSGFVQYGAVRCRVGGQMGAWGSISAGGAAVTCEKPSFDDSLRFATGSYPIELTLNGQCFADTGLSFAVYNALIRDINLGGAPASSEVPILVRGEGFPVPGLDGGLCTFKLSGSTTTVTKALVPISSTSLSTTSPARGIIGTWSMSCMLNGISPEPTLFGAPTFAQYDLALVHIFSVEPVGGPQLQPVSVTLHGQNFANFGIVCKVGTELVPARLLSTTRVQCDLPATLSAQTIHLGLSLNAAADGTFVSDQPSFAVYQQPSLAAVEPASGDAKGGTEVTITGSGFTALSSDPSLFRCKFGETVQTEPPSYLDDTTAVCVTTWGKADTAGQAVSIALNTRSFFNAAGSVRFEFFGLHNPAVIDVYFPPSANRIVVQFDSQATNRGGMNGQAACSRVLDSATVAQIKGVSPTAPICQWTDDSTLVVQLTVFTNAAPGMTIEIKPGVVWPLRWTYPAQCDSHPCDCAAVAAVDNVCNRAQQLSIDADYPCDTESTPAVEECIQPVALLQAPTDISSCFGTKLTLDASRSSGGGIKPLIFQFVANPTKSDRYYAL